MNKENTNDIIQKPITMIREEFIGSISNLINESMLPPFVLEPILKDMYFEVRAATQKQLEIDKQNYQKALNKSDVEKENN